MRQMLSCLEDPYMERDGLIPVVNEAWKAFECAAPSSRVRPAMPILFFGDLEAYSTSSIRVVTVGLNPSLQEFPEDSPFRRFPGCAGITAADSEQYLQSLCSYFRVHPYRRWFRSYEAALGGAEASFYPGRPSTALHTDIASPVATNPTWSRLGERERGALQEKGGAIWRRLLDILKPQIVLLSVAREHRERIDCHYPALNDWRPIREFRHKESGERRRRPYPVDAGWFEIMGEPSLFVSGAPSQTPFGSLSDNQKRWVGELARRTYCKGR